MAALPEAAELADRQLGLAMRQWAESLSLWMDNEVRLGDYQAQVIVGVGAVTAGSDMAQLAPMVEQVERRLGKAPEQWLVDGGFPAHAQIDAVAGKTELHAPVPRPKPPRPRLARTCCQPQFINHHQLRSENFSGSEAALGAGGHRHLDRAFWRGHSDAAAEGGFPRRDPQGEVQVAAIGAPQRMRRKRDLEVQVAGPRRPLAGQAQLLAGADALRYADLQPALAQRDVAAVVELRAVQRDLALRAVERILQRHDNLGMVVLPARGAALNSKPLSLPGGGSNG